jgi:hypothetical protein
VFGNADGGGVLHASFCHDTDSGCHRCCAAADLY